MTFGAAQLKGALSDSGDCAPVLQAILNAGSAHVILPSGRYAIGATLRIPSGTTLETESGGCVTLVAIGGTLKGPLLACGNGDCIVKEVRICGINFLSTDADREEVLVFDGVRNLTLDQVSVAGAGRVALRLTSVDGFEISHFALRNSISECDLLRVGGCCRNGNVTNITSESLETRHIISLEADGCGLTCGPIERISFEGLSAVRCRSAVRILSKRSTIRLVSFSRFQLASPPKEALVDASSEGKESHVTQVVFRDFPECDEPKYIAGVHNFVKKRGKLEILAPHRSAPYPCYRSHLLGSGGLLVVTSPFGIRRHPISGQNNVMHKGVDCCLWAGNICAESYIHAFESGVVVAAEESAPYAGTSLSIDHGGGLLTRYFHLEAGSLRVAVGDRVTRGTSLGYMGNTGASTGEHLHFQVELFGEAISPYPYLGSKADGDDGPE